MNGEHARAVGIAIFGIADAPAVGEAQHPRGPVGRDRSVGCDNAIHRRRPGPKAPHHTIMSSSIAALTTLSIVVARRPEMTAWEIKGREFGNCNCDYSCPCQFNALPTNGHCRGLAVYDIEAGFHGTTRLDGLRAAGIFRWPGPIHEGKGEGVHVIDQRATPAQREALSRILRGEDTDPFATVFRSSPRPATRLHEPICSPTSSSSSTSRPHSAGQDRQTSWRCGARRSSILSPERSTASASCSRTASSSPRPRSGAAGRRPKGRSPMSSSDSYGQFAEIHLCQSGMVR